MGILGQEGLPVQTLERNSLFIPPRIPPREFHHRQPSPGPRTCSATGPARLSGPAPLPPKGQRNEHAPRGTQVAITRNTTGGFNVLARGLPPGPGKEVLFSTLTQAGASICREHFGGEKGYDVRTFDFPQ